MLFANVCGMDEGEKKHFKTPFLGWDFKRQVGIYLRTGLFNLKEQVGVPGWLSP